MKTVNKLLTKTHIRTLTDNLSGPVGAISPTCVCVCVQIMTFEQTDL